jgi:hypothetical protein
MATGKKCMRTTGAGTKSKPAASAKGDQLKPTPTTSTFSSGGETSAPRSYDDDNFIDERVILGGFKKVGRG